MTLDLRLALAINRISQLRAIERSLLADVVDSEEFYLSLSGQMISRIVGRELRTDPPLPETTLQAADRDYQFCIGRGIGIHPIWDDRYPSALREIYDPPFLLFSRGRIPDGSTPVVAIVGTREPTASATVAARNLARDLASAGFPVVSGLARGIDLAAHLGALSSDTSGATVAVLGCGIDRICPSGHRAVAAQILGQGGCILSEYSPGIPSAKYHFPARNRIISGMSRGVVVVQAPSRSGALITADYALDQGRDLFVHRDGLGGPTGVGTRDLADDGARIIDSALGIFEEWGISVGVHAHASGPTASEPVRASAAGARLARGMRFLLEDEDGR